MNKAKAVNMAKDKIEAAIKRGVEGKDGTRVAQCSSLVTEWVCWLHRSNPCVYM